MALNSKKVATSRNSSRTSTYYVDPSEMEREIDKFYQTNEISTTLAKMLQMIVERLSRSKQFCQYSYRQEMCSNALIKIFKALQRRRFCSGKGNPFSYFTRIAYHEFQNTIKNFNRELQNFQTYRNYVLENFYHEHQIPRKNLALHEYDHYKDLEQQNEFFDSLNEE